MMEKANFFIKEKSFINKNKLIIFNIKYFLFLLFDKATEFYLKIKDEYEFNELEQFFEYFENT